MVVNRNSSSVGNRLKYVEKERKPSKFDDDVGGFGGGVPKVEDFRLGGKLEQG